MADEFAVAVPEWQEVQSLSPGAPVTPDTGPEAEENACCIIKRNAEAKKIVISLEGVENFTIIERLVF